MPDIAALRKRAQNAIDQRRDALFELSRAIHANPETAYEERLASTRLGDFLDKSGFKVTRAYRGIETSYRGDASGRNGGLRVAWLAEYRALSDRSQHCWIKPLSVIATDGTTRGVDSACAC